MPLDGFDAPAHDEKRILFTGLRDATTMRGFANKLQADAHGWIPFL
jgi:hypothetical protein